MTYATWQLAVYELLSVEQPWMGHFQHHTFPSPPSPTVCTRSLRQDLFGACIGPWFAPTSYSPYSDTNFLSRERVESPTLHSLGSIFYISTFTNNIPKCINSRMYILHIGWHMHELLRYCMQSSPSIKGSKREGEIYCRQCASQCCLLLCTYKFPQSPLPPPPL